MKAYIEGLKMGANILAKAASFITGDFFKEAKDTMMAYFPPDMDPTQKAELERSLMLLANQKAAQINEAAHQATEDLNKRIEKQEGTAKDYKDITFFGPLMLYLRGSQRPIWGFGTLYIDIEWMGSTAVYSATQEKTLMLINGLVLGFLFGERAVINMMPAVTAFMDSRKAKKESV